MSENASNTNGHEAKGGELIEQLEETAEEIKGGLAEISATFVGPIPPPDVLQGYDEVILIQYQYFGFLLNRSVRNSPSTMNAVRAGICADS